jgi:hypothetical protein
MADTQQVVNVLNHLLAIHNRSLAMYIGSARPWARRKDEPAVKALLDIARANQRLVDRIGAMIIELDGVVRYGEFPLRYADWHDLSVEFMLVRALEGQERDIVRITKCIEWLANAPRARALAEEALGEAKAHLDTLREFTSEPAGV